MGSRLKGLSKIAGLVGVLALVACQSETSSNDKPLAAPESEGYTSVDEVLYMYDEEGNIARKVPLSVMEDVRKQLQEQGQTTLLRGLEERYDFRTGEVRNFLAAEKAERFLKSRLPAMNKGADLSTTSSQAVRPYPEFGIPPELENHFAKRISADKNPTQNTLVEMGEVAK
jgi:hypothetical protein